MRTTRVIGWSGAAVLVVAGISRPIGDVSGALGFFALGVVWLVVVATIGRAVGGFRAPRRQRG